MTLKYSPIPKVSSVKIGCLKTMNYLITNITYYLNLFNSSLESKKYCTSDDEDRVVIKEENLLKMKPVEGSNRPNRKDAAILKNTVKAQAVNFPNYNTLSIFQTGFSMRCIFTY